MDTLDRLSNILKVCQTLRPGTSWNMRGDVLEQAIDGTPRVTIPTMDEINTQIAAQQVK